MRHLMSIGEVNDSTLRDAFKSRSIETRHGTSGAEIHRSSPAAGSSSENPGLTSQLKQFQCFFSRLSRSLRVSRTISCSIWTICQDWADPAEKTHHLPAYHVGKPVSISVSRTGTGITLLACVAAGGRVLEDGDYHC
jgi:hypothetical protein